MILQGTLHCVWSEGPQNQVQQLNGRLVVVMDQVAAGLAQMNINR